MIEQEFLMSHDRVISGHSHVSTSQMTENARHQCIFQTSDPILRVRIHTHTKKREDIIAQIMSNYYYYDYPSKWLCSFAALKTFFFLLFRLMWSL